MTGANGPWDSTATAGTTQHRTARRNLVLAALSPQAMALLGPHLHERDCQEDTVLWEPGETLGRVYFPHSGMISISMPTDDGHGIEVAGLSREGAAGLPSAMSTAPARTRAITRIGGTFSWMPAPHFKEAVEHNQEIRTAATRCNDWLLAQAQQLTACNAVHSADARFCRWLLQTADRVESDIIPSTQEAIAQMLGIRRTTVTLIAQRLQASGAISYRRGRITIRNRKGLQTTACGCYAALCRVDAPGAARPSTDGPASVKRTAPD